MALLCASGNVSLYLRCAVYRSAVAMLSKWWCSEGSTDSSHVSHPHLAHTTLQGGPAFACMLVCVCVCVCVCLAGLGGKVCAVVLSGCRAIPVPTPVLSSSNSVLLLNATATFLMPSCNAWRQKLYQSHFVSHITSAVWQNYVRAQYGNQISKIDPRFKSFKKCFESGNFAL